MPKKKDPDLSPDEQRRRFESAARRLGANASLDELKRTIKKVAPFGRASAAKSKPK